MKHYKKVVLDTNVLLYDPDILHEIKNSEIVIPIVVLDELDAKKSKDSEIGRNARKVIRELDELRSKGSLHRGIPLDNGSSIRIEIDIVYDKIPVGLADNKIDNQILSVGLAEKERGGQVVVISKDINLRVKCDAVELDSEDYKKSDVNDMLDIYTGWTEITVDSETVNKFHEEGGMPANELLENQFALLKNGKHSGIGRCNRGRLCRLNEKENKKVYNISPKNKEQKFAFNLLLDPSINLVTLTGEAGSGKTLLSVAAALQQVLKTKEYMRVVISKPNQPMGGKSRDIGFLPGDISEKMDPWIAPFRDNLEFIFGSAEYEQYINSGTISIEALMYMRGRSIPNSFIIVDECQNLMPKEIKAIVTRVGYGSKIVLLGDISQIDNIFLDFATNGLTAAIEAFKGESMYGHVTLMKGERSALATLASKIL